MKKYYMDCYEWDQDYYLTESIFCGGYDDTWSFVPSGWRPFGALRYTAPDASENVKKMIALIDEGWRPNVAYTKKHGIYMLPVYGISHSLEGLSITPYGCPWDAGIALYALCAGDQFRTRDEARQDLAKLVEYENALLQGTAYYVFSAPPPTSSYEEMEGLEGLYTWEGIKELRKTYAMIEVRKKITTTATFVTEE
jgi:hypothetical protein